MRASTFSTDNLERRVLQSGDFFQLHIEVSGGRVQWWKDGQLLEKLNGTDGHCVSVDQPWRTQLLKPGTYQYPAFDLNENDSPPNRNHSYLGGRCQVWKYMSPFQQYQYKEFLCRCKTLEFTKQKWFLQLASAALPTSQWKLNLGVRTQNCLEIAGGLTSMEQKWQQLHLKMIRK